MQRPGKMSNRTMNGAHGLAGSPFVPPKASLIPGGNLTHSFVSQQAPAVTPAPSLVPTGNLTNTGVSQQAPGSAAAPSPLGHTGNLTNTSVAQHAPVLSTAAVVAANLTNSKFSQNVSTFNILPPPDSLLTASWAAYYVDLGMAAVLAIDVTEAQAAVDATTAEADWWDNWVHKPDLDPPPNLEPPYLYWQTLETFVEAVYSLQHAMDTLYNAAQQLGWIANSGDSIDALQVDFPATWNAALAAQPFTYAPGAADIGPGVSFGQLKTIAGGVHTLNATIKRYTGKGYFEGLPTSDNTVSYAVETMQHMDDRLQSALADVAGERSAARAAVSTYGASLADAQQQLAAAQNQATADLNAVSVAGQKLDKSFDIAAYQAAGDHANMTSNMPVLYADVIGESRAAAAVGKLAADKAAEWAARAAAIGLSAFKSASTDAQGLKASDLNLDTSAAVNSQLEQMQALAAQRKAAVLAPLSATATDTSLTETQAQLDYLDSEIHNLYADVVNESIGIDQLAKEVLSYTDTSSHYNDDAKARLKLVSDRAASDKVTLEPAVLTVFGAITTETTATSTLNTTSLTMASNAAALTKLTLEAAGKLGTFDQQIPQVLQHRLAHTQAQLPDPTINIVPPATSSGIGPLMGLLLVIGAAATGRG